MTKAVLDMFKTGADAERAGKVLSGRLYLSSTGWLLLQVPNAIGTGIFAAMDVPGIELPVSDVTGNYEAHISVMTPEEIEQIGGPNKITERGKSFSYSIGDIKTVVPSDWPEVSRCWVLDVKSPELEKLRKTYGLSGIPNDGKYQFHITVAIRKKHVLGSNPSSKARVPNVRGLFTRSEKPGVQLVKANAEDPDNVVRRPGGQRAGSGSDDAGDQILQNGEGRSPGSIPATGAGTTKAGGARSDASGSNGAARSDKHGRSKKGSQREDVADSRQDNTLGDRGDRIGDQHNRAAPVKRGVALKQAVYAAIRNNRRCVKRAGATFVKHADIGGHPIVIDRPKGFQMEFATPEGPVTKGYPVDYGYFQNYINPEDEEELDVFVGSGGPRYGRFMRGRNLSGSWQPDERKWYSGLTDEELEAVKQMFTAQDPELLRDYVDFPDEAALLADVLQEGRAKQATDLTLNQMAYRAARKAVQPTDGQAAAGNYRKGHVKIHGMDVTIETPKGKKRKPEWPTLKNHYGYIRRTEDADGDHVDVFLGPSLDTELVFVVDQHKPSGGFDEHKVICGARSKAEARGIYLDNYEDGWDNFGDITPLTIDQFKEWLQDGSQLKPLEQQIFRMKKAEADGEVLCVLVVQKEGRLWFVPP